MGPGRDKVATIEGDNPHSQMALQQQDGVVLALRQVEQLLRQLSGGR